MKAFLIGLIFLISALLLGGLGILLYPLMSILGFLLYFVLMFAFAIFAIWLLGKLIILVWELLRPKEGQEKDNARPA